LSTQYTLTHHPALSGFPDANNAGVSQTVSLGLAVINKVQQGQHFKRFINNFGNKRIGK